MVYLTHQQHGLKWNATRREAQMANHLETSYKLLSTHVVMHIF